MRDKAARSGGWPPRPRFRGGTRRPREVGRRAARRTRVEGWRHDRAAADRDRRRAGRPACRSRAPSSGSAGRGRRRSRRSTTPAPSSREARRRRLKGQPLVSAAGRRVDRDAARTTHAVARATRAAHRAGPERSPSATWRSAGVATEGAPRLVPTGAPNGGASPPSGEALSPARPGAGRGRSVGSHVFDVVRVEPTGDAVIAGRGVPHGAVERPQRANLRSRPRRRVRPFRPVPPPLPPGSHEVVLQTIAPDGTRARSRGSVTVVVAIVARRRSSR